ncbi:MAG: conjugal transfer protein TraN [Alphaproteobacteria bacterium]|nr:conjugal transfer protein TraN [Alphaproteobacteria bacterium]
MKKGTLLIFCWIGFFPSFVFASPTANLKSGDKIAKDFLSQLGAKKIEAGQHPFYAGHSKTSQLKSGDLNGHAQSLSHSDPVSQMLHHSADSRPQVKIDSSKDSLITESQKIMASPLQTIGGKRTHVVEYHQGNKDEILTCEEPGDDSLENCTRQLIVEVRKIKIRKELETNFHLWLPKGKKKHIHLACETLRNAAYGLYNNRGEITVPYKACMQELSQKRHECCVHLPSLDFSVDAIKEVKIERGLIKRGKKYIKHGFLLNHKGYTHKDLANKRSWYDCRPRIKITYEEDSYKILPDRWISNCEKLESRVDQRLCYYDTKECTQGPQTRIIEGIPITKECWEEKLTYACEFPTKDNCGLLRARGCVQINSVCKKSVGNTCVAYTQTYQCKGVGKNSYQITGGNTPFCLDGSCRDQSFEANNEMMASVAQLSLLKDMQGKINSIFTGEEHQCSKHILSFKDCCGSGKGWGKSIGLGGCSAGEKLLQEKRKSRLCHYVGTYCAKKVLGKCIKKKSSFCCFGSKLLKAFHEQGRRQINLGWGNPKEPLCRGFTIKEVQRIDFSKLDLSEAFEDLMKNYKPQKLQGMSEKIGERLDTIKRGLGPPGHNSSRASPSGLNPSGASSSTAKQAPQRPEA